MGHSTEVIGIVAARAVHRCTWCFSKIDVGHPYKKWMWFEDGNATTNKFHPECYEAALETAEYGYFEITPGSNPRGCNCGFSTGCERCESKNGGNKQ